MTHTTLRRTGLARVVSVSALFGATLFGTLAHAADTSSASLASAGSGHAATLPAARPGPYARYLMLNGWDRDQAITEAAAIDHGQRAATAAYPRMR